MSLVRHQHFYFLFRTKVVRTSRKKRKTRDAQHKYLGMCGADKLSIRWSLKQCSSVSVLTASVFRFLHCHRTCLENTYYDLKKD